MKKLFLITLFATAAFCVFAQAEQEGRKGPWAIEFPSKKNEKAIAVSQTFTPYFKMENEERVFNNNLVLLERDMNNAKHWLSIDVVFFTNTESTSSAKWPKWLDNAEVEVNVLVPASTENGGLTWAVLGGKQTLASLPADGRRHFVRMMIPPEIIYRYFNFEGASNDYLKDYQKITSDLKKIADSMPVMATVTYRGRSVTAYQVCGKEVFSRLEKSQSSNNSHAKNYYTLLKSKGSDGKPTPETMEKLYSYINRNKLDPQVINYLPDALLPVSKTPFAWVLFDRFEAIKESSGK